MIEIKDRLARLSQEQRSLLALKLNLPSASDEIAVRRVPGSELPLSFAQERLWFLDRMFPGLAVHNICGAATHYGYVDPDDFYTALEFVINRHESLCSRFETVDAAPKLRTAAVRRLERIQYDLSDKPDADRRSESDRLLTLHAKRSFDLSRGPLIRAAIMRLSAREYRVMVCMHHIVSDGWSTSILIREVLQVYDQLVDGRRPSLPDLPLQYGDFALWQRQRMTGQRLRKHLAYWVEQLRDLPLKLDLPTDKQRLPERTYSGARVPVAVPDGAAAQLFALAASEGATPFMALLAVYATLLHRYCRQDDFAIGMPVAGREQRELSGIVGCFINLLPIRCDAAGAPTFREFLARMRNVVLSALERAEVPFELIVNKIRPDRDTNFSPLFQVAFSFEREPTEGIGAGLRSKVAFEELNCGVSRYDLSLELTTGEHGLRGWIDFSTDLFELSTVEGFAAQFNQLIASVLAHPDEEIARLELINRTEAEAVIGRLNHPATDYPRDASIPQLFFEQARAYSKSVALVQGKREVTYAELSNLAHGYATQLRHLGIEQGSIVGICVERSIDAIAAVLGILETGAAYVPCDPAQPRARTEHILTETEASCVVCDESNRSLFDGLSGVSVIVAGNSPAALPSAVSNDCPTVAATDLAYVMYTSGSTGLPKGVAVTHRNVVRLVRDTQYASMGPDEVGLLLAPLSFDASTFEIWAQLLNGGRLVIAPKGAVGFEELGELIRLHQVTTLWLTAGLFRGMVEENLRGLAPLRQLITGGDVVPEAQARKVVEAFPACRLINGYGPTEGTTFSCTHRIVDRDFNTGSIPIGKPIANTRVYILDSFLNPVPAGMPGELFLGGDGVALGYYRQPELTSERFLHDRFHEDPDVQMYRTGDQVCLLSSGEIRFLGRLDEQVKLRGFRIELGEIEAALAGDAGITDAAVVLRKAEAGSEPYLCAYVVLAKAAELDAAVVKRMLRETLPEYMVPAQVVFMSSIPLTGNGKVDRRMLPMPDTITADTHQEPVGDVEQKLAMVWKDLLKLETIGRNDNFFDLFGDSISALQMVSKASRVGLRFTSRDVFSRQSLAELASIAQPMGQNDEFERPEGEVPLLSIQRWFFSLELENPAHWNQWVLFRMPVKTPVDAVRTSLQTAIDRHDVFRLRFEQRAGEWVQYLAPDAAAGFESLDVVSLSPTQQEAAVTEAGNRLHRSLDLQRGPLFQMVQIDGLRGEQTYLFAVAHHLIVDQVAWQVFLEDMQAASEAAVAHTAPRFPSRSLPFALAARALAAPLADPESMRTRAFWNAFPWHSAGRLRHDGDPLHRQERDAMVQEWSIDIDRTRQLREAQSAFRTRIDDFCIMALARALADHSVDGPVAIDVESMGRQHGPEVGRTMGWFTQMYPVLLSGRGDDIAAFIKSAKELLRGFAGQSHALARLRMADFSAEIPAGTGRSEVAFNFLGDMAGQRAGDLEFGFSANQRFIARDPGSNRSHLLNVDALISNGQLKLIWTYSPGVQNAHTVAGLVDAFAHRLQELVSFCIDSCLLERTPSDFPLARLSQEHLDVLLEGIRKRNLPLDHADLDSVEDIYDLSPLQEGLLFHSVSNPVSDKYLVQLVAHFQGELDLSAFQQAWNEVIERHPALRTGFHTARLTHPVQAVEQRLEAAWTFASFALENIEDRELAFSQYLRADREVRFNLASPPLMRLHLVEMGREDARFVWTYHHLILDGWSMAIVLREVFALYEGIVKREPRTLPPPPIYRDFIGAIQSQDKEASRAHWRSHLQGICNPTPLPVRGVPHKGREIDSPADLSLTPGETEGLISSIQGRRLTLATVLNAAWALMLALTSGMDDVVFGVVVSGRTLGGNDVDGMVGLLINTVPHRVTVDRGLDLATWMAQLQDSLMSSRPHEHCGLAEIQGVSSVERGMPLFESVVVVENYPIEEGSWDEYGLVKVSKFENFESADFPLYLTAFPGKQLKLQLNFDTARFSAGSVTRITSLLKVILQNLDSSWDETVGAVLAAASSASEETVRANMPELCSVVEAPMITPDTMAAMECVHQGFEAIAAQMPNALAVVQGERTLTYGEVNCRANSLARYLRSQGVGPDKLVAICIGRSFDMIVAVLATWKAGGAFVPLDPTYPVERLRYMVQDSAPSIILTERGMEHLGEALEPGMPVIDLAGSAHVWEHLATADLPLGSVGVTARSLAYVIYTSGSSGRPKGVMNEHRGLCNVAREQQRLLDVGYGARVLQFSSFSFDACVFEIVMALCSGASLYLPPPGNLPIGEVMFNMAKEHQLTHVVLPPAALEMLPHDSRMDSVRLMMLAGEAPSRALIQRWGAGRRVVNGYGPTEATIWTTMHECGLDEEGTPPIGRPLQNVQVYLLDADRKPVAAGEAGELWIGGRGVARGYLNRSEMTSQRFLPDPFTAEAGKRMYQSGDLGMLRPDGSISFLGRNDFQVKVRGFRIELGEIEARLMEFPGIQSAVVQPRNDRSQGTYLAAYYSMAGTFGTPDPALIRRHLEVHLQHFMVPSAYVCLSALPLTPNGKLDREQLPPPDEDRRSPAQEYIAPQGELEEKLARIWSDLLGVSPIGREDDFYRLGGHSLLVMHMQGHITEALGKDVSVVDLLQHRTLSALARFLSSEADNSVAAEALFEYANDRRELSLKRRVRRESVLETVASHDL